MGPKDPTKQRSIFRTWHAADGKVHWAVFRLIEHGEAKSLQEAQGHMNKVKGQLLLGLLSLLVACVALGVVPPTATPFYIPTKTPTPAITSTPTPTPDPNCPWCVLQSTGHCILVIPGYTCLPPDQCVTTCPGINPTPTPIVTGTPTPTATPTGTVPPTATPTPPMVVTLTPMGALPWPFTYRQAQTVNVWPGGSWTIEENAGHYPGDDLVPPALGTFSTQTGECLLITDGSTAVPQSRQLRCSSRDSNHIYEETAFTCDQTDDALACFDTFTNRFAVPGWSNDQHDAMLEQWTLSRAAHEVSRWIDDPLPYAAAVPWVTPGWDNFPLKIVSIHGQRYLYLGVLVETKESGFAVGRYLTRYVVTANGQLAIDQGYGMILAGSLAWPSDVVADPSCDSCLLGFENDAWPPVSQVKVWRSHDEGRTWPDLVFSIPAPTGFPMVGDCHAAVGPGGVALTPLWGVCQGFTDEDWSTAGHWVAHVWQQTGASVPANFTTAPVAWVAPAKVTP